MQHKSDGAILPQEAQGTKTKTQEKKEKKQAQQAKKQLRQMRARINAITRETEELTATQEALQQRAYDPSLYEDYEEAQRVHDELTQIQKKLEALGDEWLELETALEEEEGEEV